MLHNDQHPEMTMKALTLQALYDEYGIGYKVFCCTASTLINHTLFQWQLVDEKCMNLLMLGKENLS